MKPILIFGASLSAAAMAAGFAVLADQVMPRHAADAAPMVMPAREAPFHAAPEFISLIQREAPQIARVAPAPITTAPNATAPQGALAIIAPTPPDDRMQLLSPAAPVVAQAHRPLPPPAATVVADELDLALAEIVAPAPDFDPNTVSKFDYIPLIGVYR